ncbi:hypothetical protein H6P81_012962 [Aristolochia fimbriata]|uniref:Uncharacterized protein n=1 Tax=Aristolochia fimbriata TaxID=158543 RepID=A0AAV7EDV9_ARIFI|nr:hypothetical protein H6P81_012962 [Aristolochia fimbriata]
MVSAILGRRGRRIEEGKKDEEKGAEKMRVILDATAGKTREKEELSNFRRHRGLRKKERVRKGGWRSSKAGLGWLRSTGQRKKLNCTSDGLSSSICWSRALNYFLACQMRGRTRALTE